jgi:predicted nucleic acid-binding protein
LVYLVHVQSEFHTPSRQCVEALVREGHELVFSQQNAAEFWAVCTRRVSEGGVGFSGALADIYLSSFAQRFRLMPDAADLYVEWRRLALDSKSVGRHVHDARLAAMMQLNGVARMVTKNVRDFRRFAFLEALSPEEIVAGRR